MNEKLQTCANRFAELTSELKRARHEHNLAANRVSDIQGELERLRQELGGHVGTNITRRLVSTKAGAVLVRHKTPPEHTEVTVFGQDGEEIR